MTRLVALTILVAPLPPSVRAQEAKPFSHLSDETIAQAIAAGIAGQAAPYQLPSLKGVAVYTPAVRVALAAQTFYRQTQEKLRPEDLPPWVTSRLVWVVFNRPCIEPDCKLPDGANYDWRAPLTDLAIDRAPDLPAVPSRPTRSEPTEVTTDLSFLASLGGLPSEHAVVAAAFEPEGLQPGLYVFARWTLPDKTRVYNVGRVTEPALRALNGRPY